MAGYSEFNAIVFVREPSKPLAAMEVDITEKNDGVLTFCYLQIVSFLKTILQRHTGGNFQ